MALSLHHSSNGKFSALVKSRVFHTCLLLINLIINTSPTIPIGRVWVYLFQQYPSQQLPITLTLRSSPSYIPFMYIHVYRISGITIIPIFSGLTQKNIYSHSCAWGQMEFDRPRQRNLYQVYGVGSYIQAGATSAVCFSHPCPNRLPNTCAPHGTSRSARGLNKNKAWPLRPRLGIGIPALLPVFCCLNQVIFPSPSPSGKKMKWFTPEELLASHMAKNEETVEEWRTRTLVKSTIVCTSELAPVPFSLSKQCCARKL